MIRYEHGGLWTSAICGNVSDNRLKACSSGRIGEREGTTSGVMIFIINMLPIDSFTVRGLSIALIFLLI